MTTPNIDTLATGTAKHPVYNTGALLWLALVGIPGVLLLMVLFKLHLI